VREVFPAEDGKDFVAGQRGYKQFAPLFVAEKSDYCRDNRLAYVTAHNHGGRDRVGFSEDDLRSHERGYPALVQMTGKPVTALVFAERAVAGDVFVGSGRDELASVTVLGPTIRMLRPEPTGSCAPTEDAYDRQALMFGHGGQAILGGLKVAIVGLGGGGSLINQMLARLGVGHILAVDPDEVEVSNLSRILGATRRDALGVLPNVGLPLLRQLAKRTARSKVAVAERVALEANPKVRFEAVRGDVTDPDMSARLLDCDFVFLATDTIQSRHLFNQVVHQYLIPGAQIGAKVPVDKGGAVGDVRVVVRPVVPDSGCLWCGGAISPAQLNREDLKPEECERQRYVEAPNVHEPSVITLNALGASQAANDFLFMFTGMHEPNTRLRGRFQWARRRDWEDIGDKPDPLCRHCGRGPKSAYARGDGVRLPTRAG